MFWLDSTFATEQEMEAPDCLLKGFQKGNAFRKELRNQEGEWQPVDVETRAALQRMLTRPMSHLWHESPTVRERSGKKCWEPAISAYREQLDLRPMNHAAASMLRTTLPNAKGVLQAAVGEICKSGMVTINRDDLTTERPPIEQRDNGRVPMTILRMRQGGRSGSIQVEGALDVNAGGNASSPPSPVSPERRASMKDINSTVGLQILLSPDRSRTVFSFDDKLSINLDGTRPKLALFEHVEGARVYKELFPDYQLPNGKKAFMYYNQGVLIDEVEVTEIGPPPRPTTVPQALQRGFPLGGVLDQVAKPPGSAPPCKPYKPLPLLPPLPTHHTLRVKNPAATHASAFGDLVEDNLHLTLHAQRILKTQTQVRTEDIIQAPVEDREPWTLPNSIFKTRIKECDAKAFFDGQPAVEKMFERDWVRCYGKEKFATMMARENKGNKIGKDDKSAIKEIHDLLKKYAIIVNNAFMYYSSMGSSNPYQMRLNDFTSFLDECGIPEPDSQHIKRSDCDTIFIYCNFQPEKKPGEVTVKHDNCLMRYEFVEAIIRLGLAKYGKGQKTDDVGQAVQMIFEMNILPNLPSAAMVDPNLFRHERLYNEEVDVIFKKHAVLLRAIYSRYRSKPASGGLRNKALDVDGWKQLMEDADLIDSAFTLHHARLAFLWSRMLTVDEVKDFQRHTSMTFIDFLEALGRVADMRWLPAASDLHDAGYINVLEWALDKKGREGAGMDEASLGPLFKPRDLARIDAPKTRPLYAKLELLLDLVFRRLYFDPVQCNTEFNYDNLLKMIKKQDKDLGP